MYSSSSDQLKWLPTRFLRLGIVVACGAMTACAFSPGITMSRGLREAQTSGVPLPQWVRAYEPVPDERGAYVVDGKPATGILLPITPDLIKVQRSKVTTSAATDIRRLFGVAKPYLIGPGDIINIVVWDHPELVLPAAGSTSANDSSSLTGVGNGYNVGSDGTIQFPYVGYLKVSGLTEAQVRNLLVEGLKKTLRNADVTVRIQSYRSARVYIDGEIRTPGAQSLTDVPMTLPEVIGRAGGFLPTADRSSVAITRNGTTTVVNMLQLTQWGVNANDILLASGDMVQVLSRDDSKVFVLGEVLRPAALPIRNGRMTLSEALGESGGISQVAGDPRYVFVLRSGDAGNAEVYQLDASTPASYALAESFDLKPRDVVFVDPAPLVNWNRVISLLIPSAQFINVGNNIVK